MSFCSAICSRREFSNTNAESNWKCFPIICLDSYRFPSSIRGLGSKLFLIRTSYDDCQIVRNQFLCVMRIQFYSSLMRLSVRYSFDTWLGWYVFESILWGSEQKNDRWKPSSIQSPDLANSQSTNLKTFFSFSNQKTQWRRWRYLFCNTVSIGTAADKYLFDRT